MQDARGKRTRIALTARFAATTQHDWDTVGHALVHGRSGQG